MEKKSCKLEWKALEDNGTFIGYGSVFGNIDQGNDIIEHGAFTKTLNENPVKPMLYLHDHNQPIGIVTLSEDGHGLETKGNFNMSVQNAVEKHALAKQGALKGLSIGYRTIKSVDDRQGETSIRRITEVKLYEVSIVPFPMNELANITSVKAYDEIFEYIERFGKADPEFKAKVLSLLGETAQATQTKKPEGKADQDLTHDELLIVSDLTSIYKKLNGGN